MTRRGRDLSALTELSEMLQLRALAELAEATAECRTLQEKLTGLDRARARRAADLRQLTEPDPAQRAGIDAIWQKAVEAQRRALEAQLEAQQAQADILRQKALRSVGRVSAVKKLAERQQARDTQQKGRQPS